MPAMVKAHTLARVDADIDQGRTHLAAQRLTSLIRADPGDLDLRVRRAAVSRRVGDTTEAGRWGFLTEEAAESEITAFERSYSDPWRRLRSLRLRDDLTDSLGPQGRHRLASLVELVVAREGKPVTWTSAGPVLRESRVERGKKGKKASSQWADNLTCAMVTLLLMVLAVFVVIGLVTVIGWMA